MFELEDQTSQSDAAGYGALPPKQAKKLRRLAAGKKDTQTLIGATDAPPEPTLAKDLAERRAYEQTLEEQGSDILESPAGGWTDPSGGSAREYVYSEELEASGGQPYTEPLFHGSKEMRVVYGAGFTPGQEYGESIQHSVSREERAKGYLDELAKREAKKKDAEKALLAAVKNRKRLEAGESLSGAELALIGKIPELERANREASSTSGFGSTPRFDSDAISRGARSVQQTRVDDLNALIRNAETGVGQVESFSDDEEAWQPVQQMIEQRIAENLHDTARLREARTQSKRSYDTAISVLRQRLEEMPTPIPYQGGSTRVKRGRIRDQIKTLEKKRRSEDHSYTLQALKKYDQREYWKHRGRMYGLIIAD